MKVDRIETNGLVAELDDEGCWNITSLTDGRGVASIKTTEKKIVKYMENLRRYKYKPKSL